MTPADFEGLVQIFGVPVSVGLLMLWLLWRHITTEKGKPQTPDAMRSEVSALRTELNDIKIRVAVLEDRGRR